MSWVPKVDTQFGDYRIQALIGHGGMSVVYLAEHASLGRKVALKILSPALTESSDFQERFTRESRMAAALDHPNIIPIYEAGERDGVFFIAMRYVKGSDLKQLIKQEGPLDAQRTTSIITQVASALAAAHEEGLVHRDVKPANILITARRPGEENDHVYLSDFGVAKHTSSRVALTKTGLFVGTADYAAPEQIEGTPLDRRADVYSLGCVLFECLTSDMPYDKDSEVAMMYAHLLEPPPRVTEKRPDLAPGVNDVIAKAMAKQRDDRYGSAPEFATAAREELAKVVAAAATSTDGSDAGERTGGETVLGGRPGAGSRETVLASPPTSIAAPPPATDAGTPPSGDRPPRRSFFDRGRSWLVPAVVAALAAGISAIAVLIAVGGDDEDGGAGGTTSPATTGAAAAAPGDTSQLSSLVPNAVWKECAVNSTPAPATATQSAVCLGGAGTTLPGRLELAIFRNAGALDAAYNTHRRQANVRSDFGRCDGTSWGGEGAWTHGPDQPGGHRFCYFEGNDAVIVWTHEKLGQETHADFLGVARVEGSAHDRLFGWWRFWHHRLGKLVE